MIVLFDCLNDDWILVQIDSIGCLYFFLHAIVLSFRIFCHLTIPSFCSIYLFWSFVYSIEAIPKLIRLSNSLHFKQRSHWIQISWLSILFITMSRKYTLRIQCQIVVILFLKAFFHQHCDFSNTTSSRPRIESEAVLKHQIDLEWAEEENINEFIMKNTSSTISCSDLYLWLMILFYRIVNGYRIWFQSWISKINQISTEIYQHTRIVPKSIGCLMILK